MSKISDLVRIKAGKAVAQAGLWGAGWGHPAYSGRSPKSRDFARCRAGRSQRERSGREAQKRPVFIGSCGGPRSFSPFSRFFPGEKEGRIKVNQTEPNLGQLMVGELIVNSRAKAGLDRKQGGRGGKGRARPESGAGAPRSKTWRISARARLRSDRIKP